MKTSSSGLSSPRAVAAARMCTEKHEAQEEVDGKAYAADTPLPGAFRIRIRVAEVVENVPWGAHSSNEEEGTESSAAADMESWEDMAHSPSVRCVATEALRNSTRWDVGCLAGSDFR